MEHRARRTAAKPRRHPETKSVWEADCALAGRTLVSGFQLRSAFGRVGRKSRGNKDGVPVCALSPKPAELLSQVCGCSVAGRTKEGCSSSPLAEQPERPAGSRSSAATLPWPLSGRGPLSALTDPTPATAGLSPELRAEFRTVSAYLGPWPAPGRRQKPAATRTPPPPPRAPSPRPSAARALRFLPQKVGARNTQHPPRLC